MLYKEYNIYIIIKYCYRYNVIE